MHRTDTDTLIQAMRVLAREIYCEDGVATAAIAEAADRLEELQADIEKLPVTADGYHALPSTPYYGGGWHDTLFCVEDGKVYRVIVDMRCGRQVGGRSHSVNVGVGDCYKYRENAEREAKEQGERDDET